jgi:hypothetical protein
MTPSMRLLFALAIVLITSGALLDLFHRRSPSLRGLGRIFFIAGASIFAALLMFFVLVN